jgi:hypothetical protein
VQNKGLRSNLFPPAAANYATNCRFAAGKYQNYWIMRGWRHPVKVLELAGNQLPLKATR